MAKMFSSACADLGGPSKEIQCAKHKPVKAAAPWVSGPKKRAGRRVLKEADSSSSTEAQSDIDVSLTHEADKPVSKVKAVAKSKGKAKAKRKPKAASKGKAKATPKAKGKAPAKGKCKPKAKVPGI